MVTKLTLTVDKETIEKAKKYAKEQGRSLSNIVENYLKLLSSKESNKREPYDVKIVKSLKGSLKLPDDLVNHKKALQDRLIEKYMNE